MKPNLLNSIQLQKPRKNVFDLSHDVKLSFNMGELVPVCIMECVPGDSFNISCESLLRFAPLTSPVMHRIDVSIHYFFVPNRILWPAWEEFITGSNLEGPTMGADPVFPTWLVSAAGGQYSPLLDYLGIPTPEATGQENISAMPMAAYQCIYNEYYRDQNLQAPIPFQLIDGANDTNTALLEMRLRCWEHDYFTAALPWAQKGPAVAIPIGEFNDVQVLRNTATPPATSDVTVGGGSTTPLSIRNIQITDPLIPDDSIYAETSNLGATSTTINDLRRAYRLQEWLEKNARGGTRYTENILAHFGVKSSDQRLQRPEYITGTKSPVVISEVLNTTGTDDLPQGNMAGHGVSVTSGQYGHYYCEEHGYIIGIMSVIPRTAYQQGIPKHFLKHVDRYQYFWPEFANIGEQPVLNRELMAYLSNGGPDQVADEPFGYVPRYTEYKYMSSRVAGDFRTTLNSWHLGRIFTYGGLDNPIVLNDTFVACDPRTDIFAVTDASTVDLMYAHVFNKIKAVRPMPKYGTPTF